MSDLEALLARVEKATGPDREIDHEFDYLLWHPVQALHNPDSAPAFTASIDAALALVEKVLPLAYVISMATMREGVLGGHCRLCGPSHEYASDLIEYGPWSFGATIPLAILAALLRAKIAQSHLQSEAV